MKRALLKERAEHSETAKVVWLIALFTGFLGAYLGGRAGGFIPSLMCGFSYAAIYVPFAELNATADYIRFTETLPLSARTKVWGKLIYRMIYVIPMGIVCCLGYLPGLLSADDFSPEKLFAFGVLQFLIWVLPAAIFPLLTVKREGACRQTKSILLYAFFNAEVVGFLNRFFDGSFSYAPLLWTILLCGGILLFFVAAERTVFLWEKRPLP